MSRRKQTSTYLSLSVSAPEEQDHARVPGEQAEQAVRGGQEGVPAPTREARSHQEASSPVRHDDDNNHELRRRRFIQIEKQAEKQLSSQKIIFSQP